MRPNQARRIVFIIVIVLLVIGYLLFINDHVLVSVFAKLEPTATWVFMNQYTKELSIFQAMLEIAKDAQARGLIEKKIAIIAQEATSQAVGLEHLATRPANPYAVIITPIKLGPRPTGIIEDISVPFSSMVYRVTNGWQEKFGDTYVLVAVGVLGKDPKQGVVLAEIDTGMHYSWSEYLTPEKHGAVKIVSARNNRLLLEAEDGSIIYFDVPSMSFTQSKDEILPTITPRPDQPVIISTQSLPYP